MNRYFLPSHPFQIFSESDKIDCSHRDECFIQSLKAMENIMDMDAYIIDYVNERVLYATKGCSLFQGSNYSDIELSYFDKIIFPEDLSMISVINCNVSEFFYSLPIHRRLKFYFTQDFRIVTKQDKVVLINHRGTILDLTASGTVRLTLCVNSFPTHDKPGNAYFKLTDTNTVYEFMKSSQKFVEVKTQRLTSQSYSILKLSSIGKTEKEISGILKIAVATVKYHKKRIFAQLGVKNTAEAIQWMNNQKRMVKR